MAYFDSELDKYVVRIVYDGAPLSGKTTSLTTLARLLGKRDGSGVYSPGEASGRTLFFDWLDYDGGLYNGKSIRCQIVSVPGQRALGSRREKLLATADAVVFVFDCDEGRYKESLQYLSDLPSSHGETDPTAPGILIQANKRDLPTAMPMPELRAAVGSARNVGIVESSALSGDGVRSSFVLGVGLALDRIALLESAGMLGSATCDQVSSGAELLDWLRAGERPGDTEPEVAADHHQMAEISPADEDTVVAKKFSALLKSADHAGADGGGPVGNADRAAAATSPVASTTVECDEGTAPLPSDEPTVPLPSVGVPAGYIWPPMEGRLIINEAASDGSLSIDEEASAWVARSAEWHLMSRKVDCFDDPVEAKMALIELVKSHIRLGDVLSRKRCVALAPHGDRIRLWQIAKVEQSVASAVRQLFRSGDAVRIADLIFRYGQLVVSAAKRFRSNEMRLPVGTNLIGVARGKPVYLGWVPYEADGVDVAPDEDRLVEDEIRGMLAFGKDRDRLNVPRVIERLRTHATSGEDARQIVDVATSVLIGH